MQFLEQLFAVLRRSGVLRSQRGVKGGYAFARPPHEITVLEVVELLDGPLGREATGIFADAATAARDVLAAATIADVIEREVREAGAAMYYIENALGGRPDLALRRESRSGWVRLNPSVLWRDWRATGAQQWDPRVPVPEEEQRDDRRQS